MRDAGQYSYVAMLVEGEGEGERGREGCVSSAVQCSGPVSRACYNVTMLHFTSSQIISLFSPAWRATLSCCLQTMDSRGGGERSNLCNCNEHCCHISPVWH